MLIYTIYCVYVYIYVLYTIYGFIVNIYIYMYIHTHVYATHKRGISYQRKLGSNLPSYGWLWLNEGWCVTLHHITMRSVRLYWMNGGVRVDITSRWEVWDYTQWIVWCVSLNSGCRSHCNGCMIVVVLCCHVRQEMRVCNLMLQIVMAAWMLHGLRFGRKPGQETLCFFG